MLHKPIASDWKTKREEFQKIEPLFYKQFILASCIFIFFLYVYHFYYRGYLWLSDTEGSIVEVFSFLFYLGAGSLILKFVIKKFKTGSRLSHLFPLILLSLLLLFVAAEEISWGQMIFGFETPKSVARYNLQNEISIHNLSFFHAPFRNFDFWGDLFIVIFCLSFPAAAFISRRIRILLQKSRIPIFPLTSIPLFAAGISWAYGLPFLKWITFTELLEIKEFFFAAGFFCAALQITQNPREILQK